MTISAKLKRGLFRLRCRRREGAAFGALGRGFGAEGARRAAIGAWLVALLATAPGSVWAGGVFDCVINPSISLKIGSPVATTLTAVEVDRGDKVEKGQVIARLESSVQAADVALAEARSSSDAEVLLREAQLEFTQAELSRSEKLLKNATVSLQRVEEQRKELRVAEEEVRIAKLNRRLAEIGLTRSRALLNQRIVRSPIDGVVVERFLGPGEFVHESAPIMELAAIDPLDVEAFLPLEQFSDVTLGMTGTIEIDALRIDGLAASVTVIDQVFDAASGTFGVRLSLPNPGGAIPGGLRCRLSIGEVVGEALVGVARPE